MMDSFLYDEYSEEYAYIWKTAAVMAVAYAIDKNIRGKLPLIFRLIMYSFLFISAGVVDAWLSLPMLIVASLLIIYITYRLWFRNSPYYIALFFIGLFILFENVTDGKISELLSQPLRY